MTGNLTVNSKHADMVKEMIEDWGTLFEYETVEKAILNDSYTCFRFREFESSVQLEVLDELLRKLDAKEIEFSTHWNEEPPEAGKARSGDRHKKHDLGRAI